MVGKKIRTQGHSLNGSESFLPGRLFNLTTGVVPMRSTMEEAPFKLATVSTFLPKLGVEDRSEFHAMLYFHVREVN